jgi:UDP-glucose 4-epimerase
MSTEHETERTAIVTGGAGFIGSHVVELLLAEGYSVRAVDDLSTGSRENLPENVRLDVLDITDRDALNVAVDDAEPAVVFHLAAQASVTRSVADPGRDCQVNVLGTLNVLEAAVRHGAPVVFTSTGGALYGNDAPIPTNEERFPAPISPYGASKWAAEAYVNTWREASGIENSICRLGNVYGPRQNPHGEAGVVALFSRSLWAGESPTLYGFGKPTRDYVHAADVARAMLATVGHGGTYNISTGVETDVKAVFDQLSAAAGASVEAQMAPLREGELKRSCLDSSLAREQLGWVAEIDIADGLSETYRAMAASFEAADPAR